MPLLGEGLPDFPWDTLTPYKELATSYRGTVADLSIGTPVDPTPQIAIDAIRSAEQSPGYPPALGTPELREAMVGWWQRVRGATLATHVVSPTLGSKEMVALLPSLIGVTESVLIPEVAYPDLRRRSASLGRHTRCRSTQLLILDFLARGRPGLVELAGQSRRPRPRPDQLRRIAAWAKETDRIVASDERHAALPWEEPYVTEGVPGFFADDVSGPDKTNLLALYSSSKQLDSSRRLPRSHDRRRPNDPDVSLRSASYGVLMPGPVQKAMAAVLNDDEHVAQQREIYRRRGDILTDAAIEAGLGSLIPKRMPVSTCGWRCSREGRCVGDH